MPAQGNRDAVSTGAIARTDLEHAQLGGDAKVDQGADINKVAHTQRARGSEREDRCDYAGATPLAVNAGRVAKVAAVGDHQVGSGVAANRTRQPIRLRFPEHHLTSCRGKER